MFSSLLVCLSVCVFVCLFACLLAALLANTSERIYMKFSGKVCNRQWTMIKFWWRSGHGSGSRSVIRIATVVRRALAEVCTVPVLLVINIIITFLHRVSKNVPPSASYNFDTREWILIFSGANTTDKVSKQKTIYCDTSNNLCFCTTW